MAWNPQYATPAELAGWISADAVLDAVELTLAVEAASRAVDRACARQFGQVAAPEVRFYTPEYDHRTRSWYAAIDDVMTTMGLVVDINTVDVEDYVLTPRNAGSTGHPWTGITYSAPTHDELTVTARWGWSSVPEAIKLATLMQAGRLLERRESPGAPLIGRRVDDVDYKWGNASTDLDADVLTSIAPFRRIWAVA